MCIRDRTVTSASFKPYIAKAEVAVGAHVTIDVKLSVSSSVTQVQVVAEGGVEVNTQTQELSQVIDTQQLQQLPSLTRNPDVYKRQDWQYRSASVLNDLSTIL